MSGKPLGKIVTFFNQKGGVGKTTSTCQLAGTFGHRGYDVLVADLDAQQTSAAWLSRADGANFPATLWSGFRYKDMRDRLPLQENSLKATRSEALPLRRTVRHFIQQ